MKTIIYNGPGHVLAAGGLRIRRGVPTAINEELFRQLQRDPSMTLQVVAAPKKDRERKKPAARGGRTKAAVEADQHADSGEED